MPLLLIFPYNCEGGSISGIVTVDPTGEPIEGILVTASNTSIYDYYSNLTDNNGVYTITGLPAGDYSVSTENEQGYINEWYDDATLCGGMPPIEEITLVTVDSQNDISGINFALIKPEGSISGRVSDALTDKPIEGVKVTACAFCCSDALTDAVGNYTVNGLVTGDYSVRTSNEQNYVDVFYKDIVYDKCTIDLPADIELVPVNAPHETPSIDFALRIGDIIRGRVFDDITGEGIENVSVFARFEDELCVFPPNTQTDDSGNYEIPGLSSGRYVVNIYNESNPTYPFFEAYNNAPNFSSDKIKIVEVVAGFSTNDIDFGLPAAQSISGTISGVNGGTELCVAAVSSPISYFSEFIGPTCIVTPGDYTLERLHPDGSYSVYTYLESLGYVFFDNTILPSFAEPVLPPRNDIDFTFDLPGCIEGKITDVSAVPIPNLEIALFDNETGRFKTYTYANASGEYEFNYLLPNTYKVKVLSENYCSEEKTVTIDSECIGIDFELVECTIPCIKVAVGEGSGRVGDTIAIPIFIENLQDQSFESYPKITFDNEKLELSNITQGDVDGELFYYPLWESNFLRRVALYTVFNLSVQESGILATLSFTILSGTPGEEILLQINASDSVCETENGKINVFDGTIVSIDIKPDSLNLKSKGVMPAAILGTDEFDVTTIDPDSLRLTREGIADGVAPIRYNYTDTETRDMLLKFRAPEVVEVLMLNELAGQTIPLIVTGETADGAQIRGEDLIRILGDI
jgi:hypothetical protein